jgi:mono/diheme cytochrome c family protein
MEDIKKKISEMIRPAKDNPGALFGILYPYVLIIIVIIGLYYVYNLNSVADQKVPVFIPDTTVVKDLPVVEARTIPPVDIFKYKNPTPELLQKGKELYTTNCASCHNETGAGGGPASAGLNPAPRNFISPDGWKNGRTLSAIYTTLEEGIEGSAMISYNYMTPEDRIAIAQYIRKQFMTDSPADSDDELKALDQTYNLSSGLNLPAQIPVKSAIEIVANESADKLTKVNNAVLSVEKDKDKSTAGLFKLITNNESLAFSALINSDLWRNDESSFVKFITINVNQNGFNGRVFNLSDAEWNELYNYVKQLI